MTGQVCDYSNLGVFFRPDYSYVDGEFVSGEDVLDNLQIGDHLEVTVVAKTAPQCSFPVEVRWMGESQTHNCFGFGSLTLAEERKLAA